MRLDFFRNTLKKTNADAYLITDTKNVYYFTGFRDIPEAALNLVVGLEDAPILFVSPLSMTAATENVKNCRIKGLAFGKKMIDAFITLMTEMGVKEIHYDSLLSHIHLELVKRLNIKFVPNPELATRLRRIKDETELTYVRKASELADQGIQAGIEAIKPGMKEYEVAAAAEHAMRSRGSEGTSFETIVASGPRSAYPHGLATTRVIHEGDLVTVDLGATYAGYCSDLTRTVVAGHPSVKQLQMLNLVSRAQETAFQKFSAGVKAKDVDSSARAALANSGYAPYFIHGLGHGIGLSLHESPTLSPSSEDTLEERNVVTVEPGVYIKGFGGVRIEDMVLIHKNKGERLTKVPWYL